MKQVSLDRKSGEMVVLDVPAPALLDGGVLVATCCSLISAGTERATVETGRESLLSKARRQPGKVRELVDKALTQGVGAVVDQIQNKLASLTALGYSAAGVVTAVGPAAARYRVGDRVACAGSHAPHAEVLSVPVNLCAPVPAGLGMHHACYATLGAIALQGIRQADVRVGENVAVVGLGLLGQLTVQILRAAGCRVLACDLQQSRIDLALSNGASAGLVPGSEDPRSAAALLTGGFGFDAVILTATTSSSEPLVLAGELARDRARVVIVGSVGGEIPRSPYYEKELTVLLSRSSGPGRYDPVYEEHGVDYPVGYVRWTEGRNLGAFLDLAGRGSLDLDALTTGRYPVERAPEAYASVAAGEALGIILDYAAPGTAPAPPPVRAAAVPAVAPAVPRRAEIGMGLIGAGGFARDYLLPHLSRDPGVKLISVATAGGLSARQVASRFRFQHADESVEILLARPEIQAVVIATRHDSHAGLVCSALRAGKSVFVEKPLALTEEQLLEVERAARETGGLLCVGFNRRFAPLVRQLGAALTGSGRLGLSCRVNAGAIPAAHWVQDPAIGGGRILGEACHFFDLLAHLAGSPVVRVHGESFAVEGRPAWSSDNAAFTLTFADGSVGTVGYWAGGAGSFPKECVEVFGRGISARLDDYRSLRVSGPAGDREWTARSPDKGHAEEMRRFALAARGEGTPPIPPDDLFNSTRATLCAARSLVERLPVDVPHA